MKRALLCHAAALAIAALWTAIPAQINAPSALAQAAGAQNAVKIDSDDIGGVVTGPHGPEAGVWVIAETHDLPTRFAKMVVTDDQGRYRRAGSAEGKIPSLGPRLWPGRFSQGRRHAGSASRSHRRSGAGRCRGGKILSGDLLVLDAENPGQGSVRRQERYSGEHHAGQLAHGDQEPSLCRLPSARPAGDADHSGGARNIQERRRRLDAARPVRPGVTEYGQSARRPIGRCAVQIFRRLD